MTNPDPAMQAGLQRIQANYLARAERRLLTWLCARMPRWVTPNLLTACGLAGAAICLAGYAASNYAVEWLSLAIVGVFLNWFGDSLDGSLARYRGVERPSFGYFIDHSCDGLATVLILAGLGLSPFVTLDVALIAAAGYLLLSIHAFLSARVVGELKLSHIAAGPTEARLVLIALTVMMMVLGGAPGMFGRISGFDLFVGAVAAIFLVLFAAQTIMVGKRLARLEP